MFQIKHDLHIFNMITVKNESKIFKKRLYHTNPSVCLIRENVIQIKSTIMITVHVSECRKHYIYIDR